MSHIFCMTHKQFYYLYEDKEEKKYQVQPMSFQSIEKYKKNLQEIKQRKEWKNQGAGAQFMGLAHFEQQQEKHIYVSDVCKTDPNTFIYVARLDDGAAIYSKSLVNPEDTESLVLRKQDFVVHDMAYDQQNHRLVLSASQPFQYEKHLYVLSVDGSRISNITEGECQDANPIFNPQNPNEVYYDTCGIGYDNKGQVMMSPREICLLDLSTGSLQTQLSDANYDFFKPQKDAAGNLYCIKRPYKNKLSPITSLKDIVLAPFKLINAIISWLDFFTQRYTGESLKTSGNAANPAKAKQKSAEELFIEGNLIEAEKAQAQNKQAGEKYPGVIPQSWELVKLTPTGEMQTLKKGVLSYQITNQGVIFSNGKYLICIDANNTETKLFDEKLLAKIRCY